MKLKNLHTATDRLGALKATIAELNKEKRELESVLLGSGFDNIEGDLFESVIVAAHERDKTDWEAVATKAGASRQLIAANTTTVPVKASVKVTARKAEAA